MLTFTRPPACDPTHTRTCTRKHALALIAWRSSRVHLSDAPFLDDPEHVLRKQATLSARSRGLDMHAAGAALVTDLRGLTREAAALALRHELTLATSRHERGSLVLEAHSASGDTEAGSRGQWAILAGNETPRAGTRGSGGSSRGTAAKVTLRTALDFLEAEGIACKQPVSGLVMVSATELSRAAVAAAARARSQRLRQGLLLQLSVIASGLAAMAIVPRLVAW